MWRLIHCNILDPFLSGPLLRSFIQMGIDKMAMVVDLKETTVNST